jgi:hypothetical protein
MFMNPYRKPVPIKPAGFVRQKSGLTIAFPNQLENIYLLLRTLLLSCFLASISIAIGLYSYRVYESNPRSLIDILDSIFKQSPPPFETIKITTVSGIIFAIIFYGEYTRTQLKQVSEKLSNLPKFFAGIVLVICVDIQMYKIDFYNVVYRNVYPPQLLGVLVGQVISIMFIMMLIPAFKKLARIVPGSLNFPIFSDRTSKLLDNIRYYLVSLIIILLIVYLSAVGFIDKAYFNYLGLSLPIVRSGVFLVAFGFAVLFNRLPKSLAPAQPFTFLRLVLGVLCLLGAGFFYSQTSNVEMYLVYISVSFVLSWLSIPVVILLC